MKHITDLAEIKTVFEIGSRDCLDAIYLNNLIGVKVYAFECNPAAVDLCRENLKKNGVDRDQVELVVNAVYDKDTDIPFFPVVESKRTVSDHPNFTKLGTGKLANIGASSIFKISDGYQMSKYKMKNHIQGDPVTVPAIRLDGFLERRGISRVDLICMDIQGAELMALRGMGEHLRNVRYIITELCTTSVRGGKEVENYEGQGKLTEVFNLLTQFGFKHIAGDPKRFSHDDFVFINTNPCA